MKKEDIKKIIDGQKAAALEGSLSGRSLRHPEPGKSLVIAGARGVGKSAILRVYLNWLIQEAKPVEKIFWVDFEDERLSDFTPYDFTFLRELAEEADALDGYFFFDGIDRFDTWAVFVKPFAAGGGRVYASGSSLEMIDASSRAALGEDLFSFREITPLSFGEYLDNRGIKHGKNALAKARKCAKIEAAFPDYIRFGGFTGFPIGGDKRSPVSELYSKILYRDVISRNQIRNPKGLEALMKTVALSIGKPVSFTRLHSLLKKANVPLSKDMVIAYISYAKDAFLLFSVPDFDAEKEGREASPKYYFSHPSLAALFTDDDAALRENALACFLRDEAPFLRFGKENTFLHKGAGSKGLSLDDNGEVIKTDKGVQAEPVPLWRFLLEN